MQIRFLLNIAKTLGVSKASLSTLLRSIRSERAVKRYNGEEFVASKYVQKKSDDLVILGSGPSIDKLSDSQIQEIECLDSWAFNHFYHPQIKPSLHILQGGRGESHREIALKFAERLDSGEVAGPFLARGDTVNSGIFEKTIIGKASFEKISGFIPELLVGVGQKKSPEEITKGFAASGFFSKDTPLIPKFRSTIALLVSLGLVLGYKRIILCGIDMDNNVHFFDEQLGVERKNQFSLHPHAVGPDSVVNYLSAINRHVALKRESEILVGLPCGQLSGNLSAFWRC